MTEISDKELIESFFRKNTCVFIYQIGDLDDFFWINTKWYALIRNNKILQIVYLYTGSVVPVLLAFTEDINDVTNELLKNLMTVLPEKFYAHLSIGLENVFISRYSKISLGKHYKMCLNKDSFRKFDIDENVRRLTAEDYSKVKELYNSSYPENWFDKRMLETGKYFGYFLNGVLAGVSGIHVYSEKYKVAALGNIVTDVNFRGLSICKKVTSALCEDLFETVDHIGLNVHTQNSPAISCYSKLGFEIVHEFEEFKFDKR